MYWIKMSSKKNNLWFKFFFACVILYLLRLIFLFSGTVVNKYYRIQTPELGQVIQNIPGYSQKGLGAESIKILNWNIYKGKRVAWKNDFIELARGMDIILLQEARTTDDNLGFFSVNRMGGAFARSFLYHGESAYATGVMTLSKSKPISIEYLKTEFKEPLSRTPKITLLTKYLFKKKQTTLLVVNTHGINFIRSALFKAQMSDLEKKIKNHQGPVIFAGDFNTWNKKRVVILSGIVNRLDMKTAAFAQDFRTKRFGYFLDYVFYKDLEIKQTNVFKDISSSDHKAMEIEFYLGKF